MEELKKYRSYLSENYLNRVMFQRDEEELKKVISSIDYLQTLVAYGKFLYALENIASERREDIIEKYIDISVIQNSVRNFISSSNVEEAKKNLQELQSYIEEEALKKVELLEKLI